ncbi:BICD family-like cargo adapter 1 [Maylandia zebra]|uniref:BICD family-like cargo adapter 1 isoform X2 n=2 Tax=Haplochromini TaxID=319058 RepID=A0A9Y3S099_9CICH|nr:BICD family-like cargo adapter 1 isoform X2 [Maylandia zebra]XP_005746125.1 PREDICTED: bicaudal D-related protein 1 isoform X2 [Pundamilia nyererei]XP_026043068.1 BICD family-like cargo adapter 1 isoform X2 [Astatotilapia calliptera]
MSAFCLDLQTSAVVSAPLELDSDCMESRGSPTAQEPGGFQGHPLRHAGSGGLGMALEEELAMLTGERGGEEQLSDPDTPAVGHNADLLSLFRQKEKDLVLAAKLGKALLERNQDLTKQYEKMHKDLNEKLEHLEQEKHELRRRLESREGEWEGRVAELETDVQQLQGELERQQVQLKEADRDKTKAISELSEQNHRLLEQLSRAAEVERQLSTQVHSLRDDFREKSVSTRQHMTRLETLQAEIKMLSERKMESEHRVHAMLEENELLQNTVDELRERTLVLEKQCHEKDLQLRQSQLELLEVQVSHRQLAARLEELTEEHSLQTLTPHPSSLLCEIEQSMEQEEQEQEREQLRLQLWEAYCEVRSLCSHLRGNDVTDSALSTDSSMDESSETSSAKDVPTGSLHTSLLELRRLTQNLLDGNESTGSRRSDEEALEEQVRKLGEELREVRELYETEQDKTRGNEEELLQLHNQVALLSVEMRSLREENERMRTMADVREPSEQLQSAIRDRDDAIAKKKAVEMELAKCKIDIMSLNSQLLDAIQQKLNLSQQLEAWQDDMHRVIDQQLMDKHQDEWRAAPTSLSGSSVTHRGQSSRRAQRISDRDKRLFSFFKKN